MSWPSHRICPDPTSIEAQDEVHHRRLAAARAADQRRRLAGFGDEADGVQDRLPGPIAEHHVAKFDSAVRDLELGRLGRVLLVVALVEEAVEHADAEQRRRQVDMQSRHPLHRLVEHDHRGDEGKQAAGRVAADDDRIAGIEDDGGDGEAAETLHDRARARAHASELVRRLPEALDRLLLPGAHEILEREGLDDADALRGLLHRFHHLRGALELARHDLAHADADLAHAEHGERNQHQRQERQQGILRHHDDDEPDDRQRVARKCGDEKVEHAARRLGDEGLTGDEYGRMRLAVIADLHPQHLVEHAPLDVGDNAVADPRHDDLLSVGRQALDRVDDHDRDRDLPHRLEIAADEDLVDDLADDPGGHRGRQRDQAHHRNPEGVALPVLGALVGQQPTQDGVRG